jgi:2-polyprenyl-3-methyl-5-hydroxy-6-metoxy-1,4-benzoquinol methylase
MRDETQLERVERYFSESALEWQELYARPRRVNDLVLLGRRRFAVEQIRMRVTPGARVLDAGCGAGLVALDLAQAGFIVHGVDVAQNMLDLAAARFRDAGIASDHYGFEHAPLGSAKLEAASFAGAVALGFLEYQSDELSALARLAELLEPGGTLVVSGPTSIRIANYFGLARLARAGLARAGVNLASVPPTGVGLHRYGPARFRALLEASGFEMLASIGHGFVEFEGLRWLSYRAELALHRALSRVAEVLPIRRFGNDTIAVARKKPRAVSSGT